jgi:nitrogen fixation NifU-like protein
VTELVKGKSVAEVAQIKNSVIVEELSLPPVKIHCSVLAEDAIKAAVKDWQERHDAKTGAAAKPKDDTAAA